ncbi:MAG TPA: phosphopantetheine-binding protein [Aliidongia sp.]|uniref:acyl carrier protein n=1 Tax=Aliidongia sp. TaxID=1914230 RepID=UPI002DDCD113|nr:phosphopantetheine-binding protein [Aliidongia sp.]HEV2678771.1 phosphopantetheine-binding protein [Aliidongia sp.]
MDTEQDLKQVLVDVLNLDARASALTTDSPLLGALPELDSMAVAALIAAIEDHFAVTFEDEDLTEQTFATLGSLASVVAARRAG